MTSFEKMTSPQRMLSERTPIDGAMKFQNGEFGNPVKEPGLQERRRKNATISPLKLRHAQIQLQSKNPNFGSKSIDIRNCGKCREMTIFSSKYGFRTRKQRLKRDSSCEKRHFLKKMKTPQRAREPSELGRASARAPDIKYTSPAQIA